MGVKVKERKGAWWIFINYEKKRKAKRIGIGEAGKKKAAKQVASQIQARLALGQSAFAEKTDLATVGSYLQAWLTEHARVNCKPSTYAEYQWSIEHVLVPEFGVLPLDKLSIDHVRKLIAKYIEKGRSKATIRNYLAPLTSCIYSGYG